MGLRIASISLLAAGVLPCLISGCMKAELFERYDLEPSNKVDIESQMTSVGENTIFKLKSQGARYAVFIYPVSGEATIHVFGYESGQQIVGVLCSSAAMVYEGRTYQFIQEPRAEFRDQPENSRGRICLSKSHIVYNLGSIHGPAQADINFNLPPKLRLPVTVILPVVTQKDPDLNQEADDPQSKAARTVEFRIKVFRDNSGGPH